MERSYAPDSLTLKLNLLQIQDGVEMFAYVCFHPEKLVAVIPPRISTYQV
jgi:hypothetical protein